MSQVHEDLNDAEKCEAPFKLSTSNFKLAQISTNRDLYGCYGLWALKIHVRIANYWKCIPILSIIYRQ